MRIRFINIFLCLVVVAGNSSCQSASNKSNNKKPSPAAIVGGPCETCELMYIGMPQQIEAVDTSAGWYEAGQKLLVQGKAFQLDGTTPAKGVIIYYWQTDHNGLYSPNEQTDPQAKRHGHIRGWMKTGEDGKFALYTVRPASYPNSSNPQHIHLLVKEPGIANEYYIDEWLFDDDPLYKRENLKGVQNRGGNGTLHVTFSDGMQVANTQIILGLNIPNYPKN